ncbi:MAG: beta-ketoacyl synthase N-terminal-like domain-containing protein [Cyanobacteria bacterium P01_H01_bin.105]
MITNNKSLAITSWDIISPAGIGKQSFTNSLQNKQPGLKRVLDNAVNRPPMEVYSIPEFDTVKFLGTKGTRSIDRTTALAIAAAGMALDNGQPPTAPSRERTGVVLGTSTGSLKSIGDFIHEMYVQQKPYFINPACFPNIVLNCAASQTAIRYGLKGINATVSGGQMSMILALRYAFSKIAKGYIDSLITGSVEELSEQSAWSYYHSQFVNSDEKLAPGEGCAMFLLEETQAAYARGVSPVAELLASEVRVYPVLAGETVGAPQIKGLADCIHKVLEKVNVSPTSIDAVSKLKSCLPDIEKVQTESLRLALGEAKPAYDLTVGDMVGDCFSASGAFQLAALLSLPQIYHLSADCYGLMLSVQADGVVGCVLLKIRGLHP